MSRTIKLNPATLTAILAILFACGALLISTSGARAETTFVVNSANDASDFELQDGVCDADSTADGDQRTLRAAIQGANAATGADTIQFGIPGDGVHTIHLAGQLPTLNDASGPTTIDGYTQPGSSANTEPLASNARIMVQIEGGGSMAFAGLAIESPSNVVRGLALYGLRGAILLSGFGAHDNRVEGNFLGTDAAGIYYDTGFIPGGYASGVRVESGASRNLIGGTAAAARNVISGNASHGVGIYPRRTDSNVVVGNISGLTPSGRARLERTTRWASTSITGLPTTWWEAPSRASAT